MDKISGVVLTYNGEKYLNDCLQQLKKVVDELIVIDSGSVDKSVEIAKKYATRVEYHPFENYGKQCNFAVSLVHNKWVIVVDQDEILSEDLVNEINQLKHEGFRYDGYFVKRNNYLFGKLVRFSGWGNDYVLRLFNRDKGKHTDKNFAIVKVDGNTAVLKHPLMHFPYGNVEEYLRKMHVYAEHSAKEMFNSGKRFRLQKLLFNPLWRFFKKYFLELGMFDGLHGFVLAVFSYYFVFLKYVKLWELEKNDR